MLQLVRAIYKDGLLRPLEPLDVAEGETVNLTVTTESESLTPDTVDARLRAAGLLMEIELDENVQELSPEERDRIGRLFVGVRPSEELIDEDRGLY